MSAAQVAVEAERLAVTLAKLIWVANGGAAWAESQSEGGLLALESLVQGLLEPRTVVTSAALRYLSALEHAVHTADYEDVAALTAELRWAEGFLAERLETPLLAEPVDAMALANNRSAGQRHERLRHGLQALLTAQLKAAEVAA